MDQSLVAPERSEPLTDTEVAAIRGRVSAGLWPVREGYPIRSGIRWDFVRLLDALAALRADLARVTQERDTERARAEAAESRLEAAEAKAAVLGGDWCRQNRAEGRGPCGCCSLCVRDATERAEAAERRAAGMEAALRAILRTDDEIGVVDDLGGVLPAFRDALDKGRAALRDPASALQQHDAETRRAALREAAESIDTDCYDGDDCGHDGCAAKREINASLRVMARPPEGWCCHCGRIAGLGSGHLCRSCAPCPRAKDARASCTCGGLESARREAAK